MKTTQEKLEKISVCDKKQALALIYEWVKTGVLSKSEFTSAISLLTDEK